MALRIAIDEDLSPSIAQGLWLLGYDATSVRDRGRLGMKDWQLLPWLVREQLTLVTDNGVEWSKRLLDWRSSGNDHYGLLIVDQRWRTDGVLAALQRYLEQHTPDSLLNQVVVVDPPEAGGTGR